MTVAMEGSTCALFQKYPRLASALPRLPLSDAASPVRRLAGLERHIGRDDLWLKNDGLYGTLYGGNKARKLEFILPDVLRRGASTILTFGGLGSHHCLATALYGRQVGLKTAVILVDQPPLDEVMRNLALLRESGARLYRGHSLARSVPLGLWLTLRHSDWRSMGLPYILPTGGSTPLGCLGYVNAALELAQQIEAGELPSPGSVVVALGSNGTSAGLLLGLRLAGLDCRLVTVRVSDFPTTGVRGVVRLANHCARLLRKYEPSVPAMRFESRDLTVVSDWLGRGYGHPTPEAEAARALLSESEGLLLDLTYTAKTVAALQGLLSDGALPAGPVLYWHTLNALPLPDPLS